MVTSRWTVAALAAVTVALAGCGRGEAGRPIRVTIASYGSFPATTITGTDDPAACAQDGRAIVRDARLFLAHSGPAASYSADTYYIDLRTVYADFQVHGCTRRAARRAAAQEPDRQPSNARSSRTCRGRWRRRCATA